MESLVLALIIVQDQHRRSEKSLPELNDFQPFDLQALRNLYKAKDTPPSSGVETVIEYRVQRQYP